MKEHSEFSYLLYVPSETTFSSFKKVFDSSYLDKVIFFIILKGTTEWINVPIFTVISRASDNDKNYAFVFLKKVVKYLDISGFNFLADAAYDSSVEVECNLSTLFLIVLLF